MSRYRCACRHPRKPGQTSPPVWVLLRWHRQYGNQSCRQHLNPQSKDGWNPPSRHWFRKYRACLLPAIPEPDRWRCSHWRFPPQEYSWGESSEPASWVICPGCDHSPYVREWYGYWWHGRGDRGNLPLVQYVGRCICLSILFRSSYSPFSFCDKIPAMARS